VFQEKTQMLGQFSDISYIFCRFDSPNITIAPPVRLYGCIFPDGSRYAGDRALSGDLEDALYLGIDTNNLEAMNKFYAEAPVSDLDLNKQLNKLSHHLATLPLKLYDHGEKLLNILVQASTATENREQVAAILMSTEPLIKKLVKRRALFVELVFQASYTIRKIALRHVPISPIQQSFSTSHEEGNDDGTTPLAN
jgi:hypothetical protein